MQRERAEDLVTASQSYVVELNGLRYEHIFVCSESQSSLGWRLVPNRARPYLLSLDLRSRDAVETAVMALAAAGASRPAAWRWRCHFCWEVAQQQTPCSMPVPCAWLTCFDSCWRHKRAAVRQSPVRIWNALGPATANCAHPSLHPLLVHLVCQLIPHSRRARGCKASTTNRPRRAGELCPDRRWGGPSSA